MLLVFLLVVQKKSLKIATFIKCLFKCDYSGWFEWLLDLIPMNRRCSYDVTCSIWTSPKHGHYVITSQKMKFSIKEFFSKFDQIRRKLLIWSHLLKKPLMENFIFCAVFTAGNTVINWLCFKFTRTKVRTNQDTFKSEGLALLRGKNNEIFRFI